LSHCLRPRVKFRGSDLKNWVLNLCLVSVKFLDLTQRLQTFRNIVWPKISVKHLHKIFKKYYYHHFCWYLDWDFADAVSFLTLRPRLLFSCQKLWDCYWDFWFWSKKVRLKLSFQWTGLKHWDRDWYHPSPSLGLKTLILANLWTLMINICFRSVPAPAQLDWVGFIISSLPATHPASHPPSHLENVFFTQFVFNHIQT
jgi:hypothetical protein